MLCDETLLARIRGEYAEMPGLRLTLAQACRLWQVDTALCRAALDALIERGIVYRTPSGQYACWPPMPRPLKRELRTKAPVRLKA